MKCFFIAKNYKLTGTIIKPNNNMHIIKLYKIYMFGFGTNHQCQICGTID